jgi:Protein of unknown function (DUF1579)
MKACGGIRWRGRIARGAGACVLSAVLAAALPAQGPARLPTLPGVASAAAAPLGTGSAFARRFLRRLVGRWRFEIWFAGNLDGPPDASGTRQIKSLYDELRVEWTETLDHSPLAARGTLGFDPASGRFFTASAYSGSPTPDFMTGTPDEAAPQIALRPLALSPDPGAPPSPAAGLTLSVLDDDHFTVTAMNRSWRAVFTRQP